MVADRNRSMSVRNMRIIGWCVLACGAAVGPGGCAPITSIPYNPAYIPNPIPAAYGDAQWQKVLRDHVRDGLVDYARLSNNREPLERYLALISVVGPESTPNLFRTRSDQMCYYINAYNACVLRAVLTLYPTSSIHRIETPRLDYEYHFRVDRRIVKLAHLREKLHAASGGDVRVIFCLSEASFGSPALAAQSYRPNPLREQMLEAAQRVLENPALVRIDDRQQTLFLWHRLIANRERCLAYHKLNAGAPGNRLSRFLAQLTNSPIRERLERAPDYRVALMPVDRRLNDAKRPLARTDVPVDQ